MAEVNDTTTPDSGPPCERINRRDLDEHMRVQQAKALLDSGMLGDPVITEATAERLVELYRLGLLGIELEGVDLDPDGGHWQ